MRISIHALREEGDVTSDCKSRFLINFYPRPPRGGRPVITGRYGDMEQISIHALREEGDTQSAP